MIELRHLLHALALAEHRNFGRAARAVHLSQSALSRSIQALEGELGLRLFEREHKGVEPTDAGRLLLRRARNLVAQVEDLERESRIMSRGQLGELRIACGPYPARMVVAPAIGELMVRHPQLRFEVSVDHWVTAVRLVRERQADLAICEMSEIDDPQLEITPLDPHPVYVVARAAHPMAGRKEVPIGEVLKWPLAITARLPPRVLNRLLPAAGPKGFSPAVHCENLAMIVDLVGRSDVVSLLPLSLVEGELRAGTHVVLRCAEPWLQTAYGILRIRERTLAPTAKSFISTVKRIDQDLRQREARARETFVPD